MNPSEVNNAITVLVALAGPYLVQVGLTPGLLTNALTGIVALATLGWALYSHWNKIKVPETTPTGAQTSVTAARAFAILAVALIGLVALGQPQARAATLAVSTDPLTMFISGLSTALKNGSTSLVADLQAADADAIAHNDTISDPCYKAEISFVQGIPSLTAPAGPIGPIQLFQIKRDVQGAFAAGIPNSLKLGCGPLWLDEQSVFAKFTAALAGVGIAIVK